MPCWHDTPSLTWDNDTADSWKTGWRRQPPIYQESLQFLRQHAEHRSSRAQPSPNAITPPRGPKLPSRNMGQIPVERAEIPRLAGSDRIPALRYGGHDLGLASWIASHR